QTAMTALLAYNNRHVATDYRFEPIRNKHIPQLMDLSRGFFEDESVTAATGSTIDNCRKAMEYVFAYTIAAHTVSDISRICYGNATNKPVGFRLAHPIYRDPRTAPFTVPEPTLDQQETSLLTPLDNTMSKIWDIYPEEEVVYKGEVVYLDRKYRKAGIYRVWMEYDLDLQRIAKETGANLYASLCTARQTKGWFKKLGYQIVYTSSPYVTDASGDLKRLPQGEIHWRSPICTIRHRSM
ncbi:hypothetical protein PFISCL1PPCAC_28941, partial [Pristionchus fissidentatus]